MKSRRWLSFVTVAGGMEGRILWDEKDVDEAEVRRRLS